MTTQDGLVVVDDPVQVTIRDRAVAKTGRGQSRCSQCTAADVVNHLRHHVDPLRSPRGALPSWALRNVLEIPRTLTVLHESYGSGKP